MKYLLKIPGAIALLVLMALVLSCAKDPYFDIDSSRSTDSSSGSDSSGSGSSSSRDAGDRLYPVIDRNVMIMISGGRNSLSSYLATDLEELVASEIPSGRYASENVLIIISRIGSNKNKEVPAVMYRAYRDKDGMVVRDTLMRWGGFTPIFGENTLKDALQLVVDQFPGSHYGIVLSSHGTGYLPDGYYKDPEAYEAAHGGSFQSFSAGGLRSMSAEKFPPIQDYPAVKTIGQDDDAEHSVEMELKAFRDAIPCRMDYILMDACLMGCIEVAYELRDKAAIIGFSPTEILADGFDYKLLTSRLLCKEPDPVQVCKDYFYQYKKPDGTTSSGSAYATISAVNTKYLDALAQLCRGLFEKYRENMDNVNADIIQHYFRFERHFFYDMRDILVKSGISGEDLAALDDVLEKLVIYKDHTDYFISIPIKDDTYSGLSMFLPSKGSAILNSFYKENLDWNTATQLVK